MTAPLQSAKARLRQQVRERLNAIPPAQREAASLQARDLLRSQPRWQKARSILLFAPQPGEPDLWPLLAETLRSGKQAALPRFSAASGNYVAARVRNIPGDISTGQFRIREPAAHCPEVPLNRLDLVLVPGVAFDLHGRRLGRGKGFYDRLLATVRGAKCGVAFDEQIVDAIPVGPLDVRLDCILTPTRWLEAG